MSNKAQLQSNNAHLASLIQILQSKMTGGGLPSEIAELTYGTYTSTSAVSGANVNIEHGLSGAPHLFVFIRDSDYSANYPEITDNATVLGVATGFVYQTASGNYKNAGVYTKFATSGTTYASVNNADETYAHLAGSIPSGKTYLWVAWRFAV